MNPTEDAEWWKMIPNSFPNLAGLGTSAAGVSSRLSLGWTHSQQAQLSCLAGARVPVWSTAEQIAVNTP